MSAPFVDALLVPSMPHPLLAPDANPGWRRLRDAYDEAARRIAASGADTLVFYSARWVSVIGHQFQADPEPSWTHVDEEFHALGSMPYRFRGDPELAEAWNEAAHARGLHSRTVRYRGFPIDTGTIVAKSLLDPDDRLPFTVCSANMYADRAETLVLGKAARDAVERLGRRPVAVGITQLSNRQFVQPIDPADDRIHSATDDEWNRKLLELLAEGRLEDVSQLARTFTRQAHGDSKLKAVWWLAAVMGQHNAYAGEVLAYEAVHGTGCAVVELRPDAGAAAQLEFDEDDVEVYRGDRNVLDANAPDAEAAPTEAAPEVPSDPAGSRSVATDTAPAPVGAYPHARREGEFLFVSGMGPRQPGTNAIPGGPIRDEHGNPLPYDAAAQTHAVIDNLERVLVAAGSGLEDLVDCLCILVDMDRDFAAFNAVYQERLGHVGPTRTTMAVSALPTPIAVEFKVVAKPGVGAARRAAVERS